MDQASLVLASLGKHTLLLRLHQVRENKMTMAISDPEHDKAVKHYLKWGSSRMHETIEEQALRFANELNQARDAITVLQTSVINNSSRINRAIEALIEMDDAEDPRLASQLEHVMNIPEGKA